MKSVRIHCFGDSGVLTLEETARPTPGDGEVLIRVRAAGVNPIDAKIRSGKYRRDDVELPAPIGRDVSGEIEAVGQGVAGFKPGDEVFAFLAAHGGGYAEYAVAAEREVAPKPRSLDHAHAAAVPLAATTAWQGLFDHGRLQSGQRVLIHGAAGGVGHYAVQLAKTHGATVIATGRAEDMDLLAELGADQCVDTRHERFEERDRDIDLVLDLLGGETQRHSWDVLKVGGRLVSTVAEPSKTEAEVHHASGTFFMAEPNADHLRRIAELIDDGHLRVVLERTLPLQAAPRAHDALEREHTQGKTVLTVD